MLMHYWIRGKSKLIFKSSILIASNGLLFLSCLIGFLITSSLGSLSFMFRDKLCNDWMHIGISSISVGFTTTPHKNVFVMETTAAVPSKERLWLCTQQGSSKG